MSSLHELFSGAMLPPPALAAAFAAVLFATTMKAFSGFGFGLAVVPLLSLVVPPAVAVPMSLILDLIGSTQLIPVARKQADWNSLRLLVPAAFVAIPLGVYALGAVPPHHLKVGISIILLATVALMASGARLPLRLPMPAVLGVGSVAGLLSGSVAMPGPPVMVYFFARPTSAAINRSSLLMFFFFTDIGSIVVGLITGVVTSHTILLSLVLTPALVMGNALGHWLFGLAHEHHYRRITLALLALIAVVTMTQALMT
ncbi:sulfite exporter TauE/SafE family protein [Parvibaculum sp.]|uniref:sulfite exporter TauE/SafE family protein n=1 Tax=Parvibaculum sp. TaxID=2024848 RepID=UPI00321110E0